MQQTGVTILRHCRAWEPIFPLSKRELEPLAGCILDSLGLGDAHFVLKLVDDAEIASLNATFMGCLGPTNVLSFPALESDSSMNDGFTEGDDLVDVTSLGEIALSVDTLAREVFLYGQHPQEHLVRLLSHAVLHLAGFDHGEAMDSLTDVAVATCGNRR